MSNPEDTNVSIIAPGEDNLEEDFSNSFLSKIALENILEDVNDREINSILYHYVPKIKLDNQIEKFVEKLQSLDAQEALVAEKRGINHCASKLSNLDIACEPIFQIMEIIDFLGENGVRN